MILDKFNLADQVAVVTGGTSGIGQAIALAFAEANAAVIATSRTEEKVKSMAEKIKEIGVETLQVTTDITSVEEIKELKNQVMEKFGQIDILVNNAGMTIKKPVEEVSLSEWNRVMDTNLNSVFSCCQIFGQEMIKANKGKIINIASIGSTLALKGSAGYCASKGGLLQLTRVLACEWAQYNIEVNAIAPAYFETPMTEKLLKQKAFLEQLKTRVPMNRVGNIEELQGLAVFLASPASSYMTGEIIYVDGGLNAYAI